jgi:hypothetical protein
VTYFLFFAAVWGLSAGIAFSKLTAGFRAVLAALAERFWLGQFLSELFTCPMCIGFHVAWIAVILGYGPVTSTWFNALTVAFAAAGINLLLAVAVERMAP